jgi:hypothetical protein
MVARRRPSRRSKTISAQGLTGQKGINLLEGIVLDMESRWTPSGPNEVGIDGYIELFDPTTRRPLGLTLAVQSKVVNAIASESVTFDYRCEPADVEYWLSGSMPVILVVSSSATREAYWVSIKEYFKGWTPTSPTTVTFEKAKRRFTKESLQDLVVVGAPKGGLYLAPARKIERLHSNLLRIEGFPERIFVADTECRWAKDVWALLRKGGRDEADAAWLLRDKRMLSFHDLGDEPWNAACDSGTVEGFPTSDWSESPDPNRQRVFVHLLNQTLRAQLSPAVRYWSREECFALMGEAHKISYLSLRRKSRISAVSHFSKTDRDGRVFESRRHMAFRGQFRCFDGQWFLEITPTYRFTRDGYEIHFLHDALLKGIKQFEGNRAVLSSVLFWADYLKPRSDLFAQDPSPIRFGGLQTLECPVGLDDKRWLSDDPDFAREAERQRDALALPDIEDLFSA